MPKPPENPITFTKHKDIPKIDIVGYKPQLDAGFGMGKRTVEEDRDYTCLAVGPAGTGKTVYPQVLAHQLGYSLLYVKGQMVLQSRNINQSIEQVDRIGSYLSETPLVVALDEWDFVSPNRTIRPQEYGLLTGAVMQLLDHRYSKSVKFLMTNEPDNIDSATLSRFQYTLFFDLPGVQELNEILEGLKVPNPSEVGKLLYKKAEEIGGRLSLRSLVRALDEVEKRSDDPEEMVELLLPDTQMISAEKIRQEEIKYTFYRKAGENTLKKWAPIGQEYRKKK